MRLSVGDIVRIEQALKAYIERLQAVPIPPEETGEMYWEATLAKVRQWRTLRTGPIGRMKIKLKRKAKK